MIIPTNLVCVLLSGITVAMWSVTINLDPRFFVPPPPPPPPPPLVHIFIWIPGPYNNNMDPPCILSTIAKIQKGQRLGSGYEWLAGLVFRVCIATRVSLQGLQGGGGVRIFRGSKYHVTGHDL